MSPSIKLIAKPSDYVDFELEVSSGEGGQYPAMITRSPAGQAQAMLRLTFDEAALEAFLREPDQTASAFGQALFASLFVGDIRRLYTESLEHAAQLKKGLRLKLRFQPPELAALPWEYMLAPESADFVCLAPQRLLVRCLAAAAPRWPLLLKTPLRILGMVASPSGLPALAVEAEKQKLESALHDLKARGLVSLTWLSAPNWQSLESTLAQSTWNILHVVGHSGFDHDRGEDYLILADNDGRPLPLSAVQLGQALARQASLRLMVLNVYEETQIGHASGLATSLVSQGLPAALVIPYVDQHAAHIIAPCVYEALVGNGPLDMAVKLARERVRQAGASIVAWGLPALYMQASDGLLFDILNPAEIQLATRVEAEPVPQRSELSYLVQELAEREAQLQEASERLALLKIDVARLAGEQAERGYQQLEASRRLAALKAEVARVAGEQAEQERQAEAVSQRLVMLMTEAERLTGEQAERERQIREAEQHVAALVLEGERLTAAQAESDRQLQQAEEQQASLRAEVTRLSGERAEHERQAQLAAGALAAVTADVNRLRGEQADREREVQGLAQRAAGLKVEAERQDAEKAERESRMEQSQAQVKTLEAEAERLTRQAAEQTRVAEEAAERVAALQAEGQRLTATARTAWARARLRYLLTGAAGGMALLAIVATIVVLLSRAVH